MRTQSASERMRKRPRPFRKRAAPRARIAVFPMRSSRAAILWRKRRRGPKLSSPPSGGAPVANVTNETHIHPTRDVALETMKFVWIKTHAMATAAAVSRSAFAGASIGLLERVRRVEHMVCATRRRLAFEQDETVATPRAAMAMRRIGASARADYDSVGSLRALAARTALSARRATQFVSTRTTAAGRSAGIAEAPRRSPHRPATTPLRAFAPKIFEAETIQRARIASFASRPQSYASFATSGLRPPHSAAIGAPAAIQEVAIDWRKSASPAQGRAAAPASPANAEAPAVKSPSSRDTPSRALAPTPPAACPSSQSVTTALDPSLADRLAEDVIRRIERRARIERERRGL